MARTVLTKTTPLGSYPTLPLVANSADVTMTAADVANKNSFAASGNDLIIVQNTDAVNPYTVTITSIADDYKRTGDITAYTLQAGEIAVLGPFKLPGWQQADRSIYLEANNAAIKFGVLTLPG